MRGASRRDWQRLNAARFPWLLTADPPVCRRGDAVEVLRACELGRRRQHCVCRFAAADIAELLVAAGAPDLAECFSASVSPQDLVALARGVGALSLPGVEDADLRTLRGDLDRLVKAGAGLTDRYADEVD